MCFRELQTDSSCSQAPGLCPTGSRRKKRPASNIQERTRQNPVDRVLAQRARRAEAYVNEQPRTEANENDQPRRTKANDNQQPRCADANSNQATGHGGQQPRISEQPTQRSPSNLDEDHNRRQPTRPRPILLNQQADGYQVPRPNGLRHDQHVGGDVEEEDEREAREEQEEQARRRHAEKHELARQLGPEKVVQPRSLPPRRPSLTVKTNIPLQDSSEPSWGKRVSLPFLFCFLLCKFSLESS